MENTHTPPPAKLYIGVRAIGVEGMTIIGRGAQACETAQRVLRHARTVSREHAIIEWDRTGYRIRDTDSMNGTFVNGTELKPGEWSALRDGDVVELSHDVEGRWTESRQ